MSVFASDWWAKMFYDEGMAVWNKMIGFVRRIGPGFVTGAADDDPSGVATYSVAGARYGYKMNWMTVFLIPAMVTIQEMCGRIGMVSGRGLAGVIRKHYSRWLMWFAVFLLLVANTINIGADLGIMASSLQMLCGLPFFFWLVFVAGGVILMQILVPYKKYSQVLKWLGFSLLVYVATAFWVKQNWFEVIRSLFVPHLQFDMGYLMTLVGFLGTTISPYLFFWQASEEIEEEIVNKEVSDFGRHPDINIRQIRGMGTDTKIGMVFSNLMALFIMLTTAATLHTAGVFDIETPQQAALALRPLAGDLAYALFAVGVIGIGLQSIPVLAGSVGYALADALDLKEGLSKKFSRAKGFYLLLALATGVGMLINWLKIDTMKALYLAAVVNGVAAVPLILIIIKLADDERVVGRYKTPLRRKIVAWITFGFMFLAVLLLLASFFGWSF